MTPVPAEYRLGLWTGFDPLYRKSLVVSSALGLLAVIAILITPVRETRISDVTQVPERFARLILKKPEPPAKVAAAVVRATPAAEPAPAPPPPPPSRRQALKEAPTAPAPDAGKEGRERARKEVAASLSGATKAAEDAVKNLSAALGTQPGDASPKPARRRRVLGTARGASDVGSVGSAGGGATASADVGRSAVVSSGIQVESLTWGSGSAPDGSSSSAAAGSGSAAAVPAGRTQASLLAVVRRYAPGIQYCYDDQLKRSPGLRGKLVAAITISASGQVTDAKLVSDSLGSSALSECVLSQIRGWKFPAIEEGTVTFQAPFVFTPPKD